MWKDEAYLLDILLAARKIAQFTHGVGQEEFERDEVLQHALMRLITIIGEAAAKVTGATRAAHSEIPWRAMIGMRNRLVHDYLHIDLAMVWEVVQDDIPSLITSVAPLVPPEEE